MKPLGNKSQPSLGLCCPQNLASLCQVLISRSVLSVPGMFALPAAPHSRLQSSRALRDAPASLSSLTYSRILRQE